MQNIDQIFPGVLPRWEEAIPSRSLPIPAHAFWPPNIFTLRRHCWKAYSSFFRLVRVCRVRRLGASSTYSCMSRRNMGSRCVLIPHAQALNEKCTLQPTQSTRVAEKPRLTALYRRVKSYKIPPFNGCAVACTAASQHAVELLESSVLAKLQDVVGWTSTTLAASFACRLDGRRRLSRLRRSYVTTFS